MKMKRRKTSSDSTFSKALDKLLKQKGDKLMTIFIQEGPEALRKRLDVTLDKQGEYIFDYLVFSEDVLKRCVLNFMPFFKQLVAEKGPFALRVVFAIEDAKYDEIFAKVFDLVGIGEGALYDYIYEHKLALLQKITTGKAKNLRRELALDSFKYDVLWQEILGILQEAFCNKVYDEKMFDNGIQAFVMMMNSVREHRSLRSFKAMWTFSKAGE